MLATVSNLSGSILMRLALIFGALTAMTAAAIVIAWMVFQSIAANMETLTGESLPALQKSAQVVSSTDNVRALLADTLIAPSPEALKSLEANKASVISDVRTSADAFDAGNAAELQSMIDDVETAMNDLFAARQSNFVSAQTMIDVVEQANLQAISAREQIATLKDGAYFNLVLGTDSTISAIDQTLSTLIEQDFALYQTVLEVRAEMNMLAGLALNMSQTRDSAMVSILRDLATGSSDNIKKKVELLSNNSTTQELATFVANTQQGFAASVDGTGQRLLPSAVLSLRQEIDAALSSALDDIYFDLVIKSDDAKTANEDSIRALMDGEVNNLRTQAALESATNSYFTSILQIALARDQTELNSRVEALALDATVLREALEAASDELVASIQPILALAAPDTGIAALRSASFTAKAQANAASERATQAVRDIAATTAAKATENKNDIYLSADQLKLEVDQARDRMEQIGIISIAMAALAPFLIWKMVSAPLNHVTRVTERLADGDLSEIKGLDTNRGEIGRLATALKVFRTGALERIALQEEDQKRQVKALEEERKAERAKRELEERERQEKEARAQEERERKAREQQQIEEARRATEAEREARAAEQGAVTSELAASLKRLSEGDLSHRIESEFPASYESLRLDYNAAVDNLAELIRAIGKSAGLIDTSTAEIAASSLDLSKRTENTAATLEETAAALSQLTASVSSAARGATTASDTVQSVKLNAESSKKVMDEAVTAMGQIEQSASKIEKIVEVIDSISFQTNLLALNAGVEAARAGEAGRGFAVVASEVRILAHRCSEAALQINELISESASHVENGVSMIDQTNTALQSILQGITDVSQNVADIAMSANEQSGGIAEINTAVEDLDRSTQQNAAMFEETTAASQSLTAEASTLSQIIAGFRVPGVSVSSSDGWANSDDDDIHKAG